ncbi:MAG: RsmD family RNA methyltransferase [Acidilobaceae archaeon]
MSKASLGELARLLEKAAPRIPSPRLNLEQYTTPADLALKLALHAKLSGLLEDGVVADLGAGTCRLALAALLLGASKAVAVEADLRLSSLCLEAARELGVSDRLLFIASRVGRAEGPLARGGPDVILMNPPFGVHRRGSDTEFLLYAFSLEPSRVYAILKSGNLSYHASLSAENGYRARRLWSDRVDIPACMRHHKSRVRRVKVDIICFEREEREQDNATGR